MTISQTRGKLSDKLVICSEVELRIHEQHVKLLLELLQEIVLDDSHFHVGWQDLVELIVAKERVGAGSEMWQGMKTPFLDDVAGNVLVGWQLSTNFDNQILKYLDHMIGILLRW